MVERWADIKGYEGKYQVSTYGNIRRIRKNDCIILKPMIATNGYSVVGLWKDGKQKKQLIHRLVAETFIDNLNNCSDVNHIDENKNNNNVQNLEWCTHKYNMNYGKIKEKISRANKGKESWNKGRQCPQISARQAGKLHPHKGYKTSEKTKLKISEANKGKESWNAASVFLLTMNGDLIKQYKSLTEAGLDSGSDRHRIAQVCRGERESLSGYKWCYAKDYIKFGGK